MPDLPSPALVVDLDIIDANVDALEELARRFGTIVRPHFKTHRCAALARRQLRPHAPGMTCSTIGEAEVLADNEIDEILLANEIVGADKVHRAATVAKRISLTVAVDSEVGARRLSGAAAAVGAVVDVLIDIDVGLGRCGVRSIDDAVELAAMVTDSPGLRMVGIMGYEGRIRTKEDRHERLYPGLRYLAEVRERLTKADVRCDRVSAGGTSSLLEVVQDPVVTEVQAGTYAVMEPSREEPRLPFRCAAQVLSTVISRNGRRTVVDAGRKTIGCDDGLPVPVDPGARVVAVSEEHLVLQWDGDAPELGSRVALRPSHIRTTFNLHDHVWLWNGADYVKSPIDARGASQ